MLCRGMIEHHVQHDAHIPLPGFRNQFLQIRHRAEARIDTPIVRHIIAIVPLRGWEEGCQPEIVCSQRPQIVKPPQDPPQITDPVPIRILKGSRINLIDHFVPDIQHTNRFLPQLLRTMKS